MKVKAKSNLTFIIVLFTALLVGHAAESLNSSYEIKQSYIPVKDGRLFIL